MFEIFENHLVIICTVFILIFVYNAIVFAVGGKQVESRFRELEKQSVLFHEAGVSGYSGISLLARLGVKKALEVVVTEKEVWIKGIFPMFSFIAAKYDLLHKIPLSNIKSLEVDGKTINLRFTNETGDTSDIKLIFRQPTGFMDAAGGENK